MGFLGWLLKRKEEPQISLSVEIVDTSSKPKSEPEYKIYYDASASAKPNPKRKGLILYSILPKWEDLISK